MPKRNDGNEQDLRVRPRNSAKPLDKDNPYGTPQDPTGASQCNTAGSQTDLPPPPVIVVPGADIIFDWADLQAHCPQGLNSQAINNIIIQILKAHFINPDKIFNPALKDLVYSDTGSQTKISIGLNTDRGWADEPMYPAIVVKRGDQKSSRVVMGDLVDTNDWQQGNARYARFVQGATRLMVLSTMNGQVELLADEVYELFNCLSPILRTILPFSDFEAVAISEVAIVEDMGQTLGVAIDVVYAYEYGWTIRWNGPNLAGVIVQTDVTIETLQP